MGMSVRRKLQIATWAEPSEGCIYATLSLDVSQVLTFMEKKREQTGKHITITHIVGKAIGLALKNAPGLNGRITMDRFVAFKTVDASFLAMLEGGKNLAKVKVSEINTKTVDQIAGELQKGADRLRTGQDENFKKSMSPLKMLPTWLIRPMVAVAGYAAAALGLNIPVLGVESFPFGACLITSVGMLGVDEAFAPFTPFARVPLLVLIGSIRDGVSVVDGEIKIKKKVKLTATIDHRFLDGAQGAALAQTIRKVFDNPDLLDKQSVDVP